MVPGPAQVAAALSRLATLPNPNDPAISDDHRFIASPWQVAPMPGVDPQVWDTAEATVVQVSGLTGTAPYLKRRKVARHILSMGQSLTPFTSLPLVIRQGDRLVIVDGHHRLCALMLLGVEDAPVWLADVTTTETVQ